MKYIRGQDGGIYSVSRLKPPCRHTYEGEASWHMSVVTWSGEYITYATFRTEAMAVRTYSYVWQFMESDRVMITFKLGVDGMFRLLDGVTEIPSKIGAENVKGGTE